MVGKDQNKVHERLIRQDAEIEIVALDLNSLLKTDVADLSKVKKVIKTASDTESQIRYLRIEAFAEAKKVRTDEQKGRLRKLMENPACMMGGNAKRITEGMMGGEMLGG